ncbi:MAG: hypothetical protein HYV09_22685 [Deltaproteobacteria bacterium]|nr:hypothetical protein [Deltaproteobacteria bacterium]
MQIPLTASAVAAITLAGSVAPAARCEARPTIEIDVAPTKFDPPLAKLVAAQLSQEADDEVPCAAKPGLQTIVRIEVRWPDAEHASLRVEIRRGNTGRTAVRTIDLKHVPTDGRPLAVSIAATELVDEIVEAERVVPTTTSATAPIMPPPRGSPVRRERDHLGAFAPMLAFDAFTAGPTLLGADARTSFMIGPRVDATVRFGVRAPLDSSTLATSFVFGAALGVSTRALTDPWGVSGRVRVDAISLPASTQARATIAVPAIGAAAWVMLGRRARWTVDAAIGAPIRVETTAARGLVVSFATGVALSF